VAEAAAVAETVEEVAPGVWHWSISDERLGGFVGDSYAVAGEQGVVLVDPHRLAPEALAQLGPVEAIVLSNGSHQRSTWRLRKELGVPVHAPTLSKEIDEEPEERYGDGDELPGGLRAVYTPGAGTTQHTLLRGEIAIVPDVLVRAPGGAVRLVPEEYAHDIDEARRSAEKLLELPFSILLLAHGGVVEDDPKAQIRAAIG
jgi:Metallo-beta-lactamase superfamily